MNPIPSRTLTIYGRQRITKQNTSITKEQDSQTLPYHLPTLYGTFPPAIVLLTFAISQARV